MDKENQIEEMAKCENCVHHEMCIDKISCGVLTADKDGLLKLECKYYQPKINENEVVISKEEYERIWKNGYEEGYAILLDDTIKKVSNETAEKIWFQASTIVNKTKHLVQGREYLHLDVLKEIIKQFGVDLGEEK